MSKWLSSVNNLLEKLDDTAEAVAEEHRVTDEEDPLVQAPEIEEILAKRGLAADSCGSQVEESHSHKDEDEAIELDDFVDFDESQNDATDKSAGSVPVDGADKSDGNFESTAGGRPTTDGDGDEMNAGAEEDEGPKIKVEDEHNEDVMLSSEGGNGDKPAPEAKKSPNTASSKTIEGEGSTVSKAFLKLPKSSNGNGVNSGRQKELVLEAKEAQKEARTLRRHVLSLNSQLESAEIELQAQRKELERAAKQMEKDRIRTKEAKEAAKKLHITELETLRSQQDTALKVQQAQFEQQVESYRKKLVDMESQRKQEDGDWSKEMTNVMEREKDLNQRLMSLEDEKVTLISQISTLQGQQEALGSRLESLTQAADNAADREREAEDRLDNALTQHARQISQRQTREAALERTIQELNVALAAKTRSNLVSQSQKPCIGELEDPKDTSMSIRVDALQNEYDNAVAHLALEKEKSEALQKQLREMSKENTQEASASHTMQLQYGRKVADLELTISKLQREKRQHDIVGQKDIDAQDEKGMSSQVKVLSDQLMNLREKISNQSSESFALKNRLQIAIDRAQKAEDQLALVSSEVANDSKERNNLQLGLGRRRRVGDPNSGSIRTAMRLNTGEGERTEKIGQVVDVVDSFAVSTGKYLRRNPIARAGFIFYLVLIHLWTFVLLFFHAHSFDTAGGGSTEAGVLRVVHGPNTLMQQGSGQSASP